LQVATRNSWQLVLALNKAHTSEQIRWVCGSSANPDTQDAHAVDVKEWEGGMCGAALVLLRYFSSDYST
jgi:hypothetical protein